MWRNIGLAHNKLYRNFIILQEDQRGYAHSNDKVLSGYAKVEAKGDKCKVSFYAQNLRQEDNYSMVLICCKRDLKQLIDLGPLVINTVGKGDTGKEYYVNNIAGLGMSYDKISGAAICKVKDNEPEVIMHGFMNGEESTDNWRKFKLIKADSKKIINKLDAPPEKRELINPEIVDKPIISQSKETETKIIEKPKSETVLIERNKEEVDIKTKNDIEVSDLKVSNANVEDKQQSRVPVNNQNITEPIDTLDEDRNKCKEVKEAKEVKEVKEHDKHDKCDKHDKYEKIESIEEDINKLAKKLDTYDGKINLMINNIHEDVIIYGFIKDKKSCDSKWKKFKVEKKCRNESEDLNNVQCNSRRIEENFKLDKLNEFDKADRIDRLDIVDFDEYENDIQQLGTEKISESIMDEAGIVNTGVEMMDEIGTVNMEQQYQSNMQPEISKKDFNMIGEVGKYFEKLAESFEQYNGSLADINYCKFYKINVNSIDDLSDDSNYNQYTLAYYPMLNYYPYISNGGHFLLGYKCNSNGEMKYIVYAIPGSKSKSDQPYGGRTGFVTWTSDNEKSIGYWLMFYDFKNSSIVIPTK
jgi:hypothetical protein